MSAMHNFKNVISIDGRASQKMGGGGLTAFIHRAGRKN